MPLLFLVMLRAPPACTFFPYTTLFRSCDAAIDRHERSLRPGVRLRHRPRPPRNCHEDRGAAGAQSRSEEHTSELQSHSDLVCRLLLVKHTLPGESDL